MVHRIAGSCVEHGMTTITDDRAVEAIAHHAERLPALDDPGFGAMFDRFADARVVLLGEASHGTSEFYRARAAITRRLIERHGFSIVAVEADWPDAAHIDRFVRGRQRQPYPPDSFERFPRWMWRNEEVAGFVRWLKAWNDAAEDKVEFRGLDVYSLAGSIRSVLDYLDATDPDEAALARKRYACLTPWQEEPAMYGRMALLAKKHGCEDAVVQQLRDLLDNRLDYLAKDGDAFFEAEQNARIVRAAEQYYRVMYRSSVDSWNLRDRHMFDTLKRVLDHRGPQAKAVVWAHNSHIGDASATMMGWSGEFNIGELCRGHFGREAALIGFGTDRGTVACASNWDEPMEMKAVRPSRDDSWENAFLRAGIPASLTEWRSSGRQELYKALADTRLERAIGVIYRPETERQSHYFEAVLADQFDAMVWFEETSAVTPLDTRIGAAGAEDETFPFGL
jgi:erythromycin esterase-like protein